MTVKTTTTVIKEDEKEHLLRIGVYRIYCAQTDKSYIGSSTNIDLRFKKHKNMLKRRCHKNRFLQSDYDIGLSFEYDVLECTNPDELLAKERFHMALIPADKLYNIYLIDEDGSPIIPSESVSRMSASMKGKTMSEENKLKQSIRMKGNVPANKGKPLSVEQRLNRSIAQKARMSSEETRAKLSASVKAYHARKKNEPKL